MTASTAQKRYVVTIEVALTLQIPIEADNPLQAEHLAKARLSTALASRRLADLTISEDAIDYLQIEEVRS